MERERINPPGLFQHPAFTRVVTVKGPCKFIFIAGLTDADINYNCVAPGDCRAQYIDILKNMTVQLEAAGATWDDVLFRRIYALDVDGFLKAQVDALERGLRSSKHFDRGHPAVFPRFRAGSRLNGYRRRLSLEHYPEPVALERHEPEPSRRYWGHGSDQLLAQTANELRDQAPNPDRRPRYYRFGGAVVPSRVSISANAAATAGVLNDDQSDRYSDRLA